LAFTESSTNAATVTINTTRYTYGIPGAQWSSVGPIVVAAGTTYYNTFQVTAPIIVDLALFEVTTGVASSSTVKAAIWTGDNDGSAIGAPIANFGSITVPTSTTGVFSAQITPVTLPPGFYVIGVNSSTALTFRIMRGGLSYVRQSLGTTPFLNWRSSSEGNAAFPATNPNMIVGGQNAVGPTNIAVIRWRPA